MKTGDLMKKFGVSHETIRRWVTEFSDYLSDSARGVNSKQKSFTSDDYLVIATIHQLSVDGVGLADIKEQLRAGYRVDDATAATIGYDDGRMVPASVMEQVIDGAQVAIELAQVKAERDKLLDMLSEVSQKLEASETARREEQQALAKQLADLQYRLGLAEGELKLRQEQAQTPKKRWWGGD